MRLKAFAGPFGVCYQVVTRTIWQLVAVSDSQLKSTSSQKLLLPSRLHATTRYPASLLASRRTYTALYRIYPHQRVSRYKRSWCLSLSTSICSSDPHRTLLIKVKLNPNGSEDVVKARCVVGGCDHYFWCALQRTR